jgi:hypothetical protein
LISTLGVEEGVLEGNGGLAGSSGPLGLGNTLGDDLLCCNGMELRSGMIGALLGGNGGRADASNKGALTVRGGPGLLVFVFIPVRVDADEIDDLVDTADSLDNFLPLSGLEKGSDGDSEGLLGGS